MSPQRHVESLRQAMTAAEQALWARLRGNALGVKFKRQVAIAPYIVDFVSLEWRLVVEVDGAQHLDSERDRVRDAALAARGFRVLRFWNHEVLRNPIGVMEVIQEALEEVRRAGS